jgi:hypothetical protein
LAGIENVPAVILNEMEKHHMKQNLEKQSIRRPGRPRVHPLSSAWPPRVTTQLSSWDEKREIEQLMVELDRPEAWVVRMLIEEALTARRAKARP